MKVNIAVSAHRPTIWNSLAASSLERHILVACHPGRMYVLFWHLPTGVKAAGEDNWLLTWLQLKGVAYVQTD